MPTIYPSVPPLLLMLVKATAVLGVAVMVSLLLQRRSAGVRHVIWLTALAGVLVLPAIASWSPVRMKVLPSSFWSEPQQTLTAQPPPVVSRPTPPEAIASEPPRPPLPEQARVATVNSAHDPATPSSPFRLDMWQLTAALWAAVALVLLARLGMGMIAVRRIIRAATPVDSPAVVAALYEIADRIGLERTPRVLVSDDITMPFASGIVSATIVLPRSSIDWPQDQLTAVLIHELAHVWRHDMIGHAMGRVACALYWFHPMVWMAARRLRDASERACDDLALELGTVPSSYAEHLLDLVTTVRVGSTPVVAMALAQRREFEGRVLAILDPGIERRHPTKRQAAGLVGVLAVLTVMLAVAAPAEAHLAGPQIANVNPPVDRHPVDYQMSATTAGNSVNVIISDRANQRDSAAVAKQLRLSAEVRARNDSTRRRLATDQRQRDTTLARAVEKLDRAKQKLEQAGAEFGIRIASEVLNGLLGSVDNGNWPSGAMRTPSSLDDLFADPKIMARLLEEDSDADLRVIAAWSLVWSPTDRAAIAALAKAVTTDRNAEVRKMAAWSLSTAQPSDAVEPLVRALSDRDSGVRETAAWALGTIGTDEAVRQLGELLSREQVVPVQIAGAWALGTIEPNRAPASLGRLLRSSDPHVVTAAAWAVAEIGDQSLRYEVLNALRNQHDDAAVEALLRTARVLGLTSGQVNPNQLEQWLSSESNRVRRAAARLVSGHVGADPSPWPRPIPFPGSSERQD